MVNKVIAFPGSDPAIGGGEPPEQDLFDAFAYDGAKRPIALYRNCSSSSMMITATGNYLVLVIGNQSTYLKMDNVYFLDLVPAVKKETVN